MTIPCQSTIELTLRLTLLLFGNGDDVIELSLEPNDSSEFVTYNFDGTIFNFAEPYIGLRVAEYSDSTGTYKNVIGQGMSVPDAFKKSVNRIEIYLVNDYKNKDYIFDIHVNK